MIVTFVYNVFDKLQNYSLIRTNADIFSYIYVMYFIDETTRCHPSLIGNNEGNLPFQKLYVDVIL